MFFLVSLDFLQEEYFVETTKKWQQVFFVRSRLSTDKIYRKHTKQLHKKTSELNTYWDSQNCSQ